MTESLGVRAYQAIFEGNGESLMTRMKVAETRIDGHDKAQEFWRSIAMKLLIASFAALLAAAGQILYHIISK
jgi:hypothetical protein